MRREILSLSVLNQVLDVWVVQLRCGHEYSVVFSP